MSNDLLRAFVAQNVYPLELNKPSVFVGRPGFQQAGSQLGTAGVRTGQLVCEFTKLSGTTYTVAIVGGKFYTFNWSTRVWTEVLTASDFSSASITLSTTTRCCAATFADSLVVSDGTNTPWMWDGTTNGGLTKLTNAPVLYGQPVVYGAKLFGIKNTARSTIVWSEELDATTGYEQTGFTNFWVLGQTDQEPLQALVATNAALFYARDSSVGAIFGAVNADFQTASTHDLVSQTIGTVSPIGATHYQGDVFFLDSRARPHCIDGSRAVPIWQDAQETVRALDTTALGNAVAIYDPTTLLILFGVSELGQSDPNALLVYNPILKVPVAVWRFAFQAIGVVRNVGNVPVLMHLSSDGHAYDHGTADGDLWDDELNAGTQAIAHAISGPHMLTDVSRNKHYHRADVTLRAESNATELSFAYETPYGSSSTLTSSITGAATRWDLFDWDAASWASLSVQQHVAFGLNGYGRWIRPRLQHEVQGERFGFEAMSIEYQLGDNSPGSL